MEVALTTGSTHPSLAFRDQVVIDQDATAGCWHAWQERQNARVRPAAPEACDVAQELVAVQAHRACSFPPYTCAAPGEPPVLYSVFPVSVSAAFPMLASHRQMRCGAQVARNRATPGKA